MDERLNGDGTGLPFGVNDGVLGWVILGALGTVWAIWFNAQKDLVRDAARQWGGAQGARGARPGAASR